MPTTTNYGWTTPADTDLVKDGASAIRTLGSSVDTTVKNLNPETTLGDLAYRSSTANVKTRLALGTAGQILAVNSGATAPEWQTISTGGMTLLSTTTLSGATTTISAIPTTYVNLVAIFRDQSSGNNTSLRMRINGDSAAQTHMNFNVSGNPGSSAGNTTATTYFQIGDAYTTGTNYEWGTAMITFMDYANTTGFKTWSSVGVHTREGSDSTTSPRFDLEWGAYTGGTVLGDTAAITSLVFIPSSGSDLQGTVLLYGVK